MLTAVRLSNSEDDKSGFSTFEEANDYIKQFLCNGCLDALKKGRITEYYEDGSLAMDREISYALDTDCGAEWLIVEVNDYDEAENLEDIFIAGGLTPKDEETYNKLSESQKAKLNERMET
jgi:hypothetical protein